MIKDFFNILLPQACLIFFIFLELFLALLNHSKKIILAETISLVGIFLSILLLTTVQVEPQYFGLHGAIMSDSYTSLFSFIILLCGFFITLITGNLMKNLNSNPFTFQAILLTGLLGAMNTVGANDFITLFISLELLSFPIYFLIASANGYHSKEASFKYLITNAISSGIFLFGVSYLYGISSSLNLSEIYAFITEQEASIMYTLSSILIILGLFAKLAIFPFANWIVDVFKGTESSILAFISTIPKLALFGILCRLLVFPLSGSLELTFVIAILAIITATWANSYAIKENNVKAIFACSSSANMAYILLASSLVSVYNLSTVIFYLICYALMNITVFSFLNIAELNNIGMKIDDYKNLFSKNLSTTVMYSIAVIGLAGFPITSGFVAKIYLFSAIAHSGLIFIPFLIILLLLTVIAVYYYLKIILPIFQQSNNEKKLIILDSQKIVLLITTITTIAIGIYPEKLIELCRFIAYNI
ncbi:hypothetical protein IKB17_01560 [bacterium]|nr:hypothetical protein [bacterium]